MNIEGVIIHEIVSIFQHSCKKRLRMKKNEICRKNLVISIAINLILLLSTPVFH